MLRVIVEIFCSDNPFGSGSFFDPQFERLENVVVRIDDRPIVVSVSKRVGTGSAVTMRHARGHKNSIEIVHVTHHACDLPIVVETVLWRDGAIGPTGILDQFTATVPELT